MATLLAAADVSPWLEVLGRAHVLVVHAPLALVPAALLFWLLKLRQAAFACLWLGALSAVASAASGWWWAEVDPTTGRLVELHRWFGVTTAALAVAALVVALAKKQGRVPGIVLAIAALVAGVTGHFGGQLVHGSDFLTEPFAERAAAAEAGESAGEGEAPAAGETAEERDRRRAETAEARERERRSEPPPRDPAAPLGRDERVALDAIARDAEAAVALLADRCVECHGPDKVKGDFRLDRLAEDGETLDLWGILIPGAPDASTLVQRIELPPDDPDFMPEEGEPLTAEEVALLRRWIASGAPLPDGAGG